MSETVNVNAGNCGVFDGDGRLIDGGYYMTPEARERAMEPIRAKLDRIENKLDRLLASADTHPKGQDRETGLGS